MSCKNYIKHICMLFSCLSNANLVLKPAEDPKWAEAKLCLSYNNHQKINTSFQKDVEMAVELSVLRFLRKPGHN